ncbi:hypothetical protein FO519_009340 [Halicephalobus sp. NKZ332]|nr:hypothetical protein FO519_009340 [Halicephalobus sp. NKZ332]
MDGGNITRASVGRVAHVGDLYDAHSETFCGISILKKPPPSTALRTTDNNDCKIEYVHSDTFSEKSEKLGIAGELKLSILAGAFTLAGHGQYLSDEKKSARAVRSSLVYTVNTKLNALKNDRVTHVVVDVCWGANATITLESMNSESKDSTEVEGALSDELNLIALKIIKQLDEEAITRFVQLFDEISELKQELNDLYNDMVAHKFCVLEYDIKKVSKIRKLLNLTEMSLRSKLAETIIKVRSGRAGAEQLENIRKEFEDEDFSLSEVQSNINSFHNVIEKIEIVDILKEKGAIYIGLGSSLETEMMKSGTRDIYILFFSDKWRQTKNQVWRDNRTMFSRLMQSATSDKYGTGEAAKFIVVDLDLRPEIGTKEKIGEGIKICHHKNGKYISYDVLAQRESKLHLDLCLRGGDSSAYRLEPSQFDPKYNYDFTNIKDTGKTFIRGGREYFRPIGSRRYAIKVLGKYKDDKWLGSHGNTSMGEWPVAYHGTRESNALDIVKHGFDINKCKLLYGKGIYCTPDPSTALAYGKTYNYKVPKICNERYQNE